MTRIVDLHTHSNKSDGSMDPAQLVDHAVEKGLCALALTDHDTTEGVEEAAARAAWHTAQGRPITLIPGIEFSTEYEGKDIHIVGLDIDKDCPAFQEQIRAFVDSRIHRNRKMCEKLQSAGIDITYEKLLAEFPGAVITRSHYARYLLGHGYIKSLPEAFDRYVGDRCPYFVPREKVTPFQAVALILAAGGIPILAHPTLYHMSDARLDLLVTRLKEAGLVGLEAVYSSYSPAEERQMRRLAEKHGLCISGGSDFHGAAKPKLDLATGYGNLAIPEKIWLDLQAHRP